MGTVLNARQQVRDGIAMHGPFLLLPAGLDDAGQLAFMGLLSKADSAEAEETKVAAGSAAQATAVVSANCKFRLPLLFFNETLFCHK